MTDKEAFDVVAEVRILKARFSDYTQVTTEFRNKIDQKLDTLTEKINTLPCPDRRGKWESLSKQVGVLWGLVVAIILVVVTKFIER